uniref:Suppressor of lin-12-like protein-related / sel-1 protein-related n=1 Tax=Arundo donax TaxID=35708 RepID=A0A0A8Y9I9_ARUDO
MRPARHSLILHGQNNPSGGGPCSPACAVQTRYQGRLLSSSPRRSAKLAKEGHGAPVPTGHRELATILRKLGLLAENGQVNDQALERYAKLFKRPLSWAHVEALAILFGWSVPEMVNTLEEIISSSA